MTNDPFHSCAFLAFVEEAEAVQGWPDSERVKQNAYKRYEALIKKANEQKQAEPPREAAPDGKNESD